MEFASTFFDRLGRNPAVWYFLISGSTSFFRRTWESLFSFLTWWAQVLAFLGLVFLNVDTSHANLVPKLMGRRDVSFQPQLQSWLSCVHVFVFVCVCLRMCVGMFTSYLITSDDCSVSTFFRRLPLYYKSHIMNLEVQWNKWGIVLLLMQCCKYIPIVEFSDTL